MRDESPQLCAGIVAIGFTAKNDPLGRFIFRLDDITIKYRVHNWIITDPINGDSDYSRLQDLMCSESYRWE